MARRFRLLRTLGTGAHGAVHLAEVHSDEGFVQTLAVKWLHDRYGQDTDLVGRLRDEARLLALLHHDRIVHVHGLTRIDGRLAVLMEPVHGADLSRLESPMPPRAALELVAAVADALDAAWHAHPQGAEEPLHVVHRDIKPSNIMVTERGAVKVMDFGVARASFEDREARTVSQQFGTARYMAPERWLEGVANAPSDVFSLGVTLCELLTGRDVPRPRLARAAYQADEDQRQLVREMCAFEPEARPSAADVESRALDLAADATGETLRSWARSWVPGARTEPSPVEGTEVLEDAGADTVDFGAVATPATSTATAPVATIPSSSEAPAESSGRWWVPLAAGTVAVAVIALTWATLQEPGSVDTLPETERVDAAEPDSPGGDEATGPEVVAEPDSGASARTESDPPKDSAAPARPPTPEAAELDAPPTEDTVDRAETPGPRASAEDTGSTEDSAAPSPQGPTTPIVLIFDDRLEVDTPHGEARSRRAISVPTASGTMGLTVRDGDVTASCTILVDASPATFRVELEDGQARCNKEH